MKVFAPTELGEPRAFWIVPETVGDPCFQWRELMYHILLSAFLAETRDFAASAIFERARHCANMAKYFGEKKRTREYHAACRVSREALIQGVLTVYLEFRVASSDQTMFTVAFKKQELHFERFSLAAYPRFESVFVRAKVGLASVLSSLLTNSAVTTSDFLVVLDEFDALSEFDVALAAQRVQNALTSWRRASRGEAIYELRIALNIIRKKMYSESSKQPSPKQRYRLRHCLNEARRECQSDRLSLPILMEVFNAIDDLPYTSTRILRSLKRLQEASRLARSSGKYQQACQEFELIEKDLLCSDDE